jgi:hypothetical protein
VVWDGQGLCPAILDDPAELLSLLQDISPGAIRLALMLYTHFPLSVRNVEDQRSGIAMRGRNPSIMAAADGSPA